MGRLSPEKGGKGCEHEFIVTIVQNCGIGYTYIRKEGVAARRFQSVKQLLRMFRFEQHLINNQIIDW